MDLIILTLPWGAGHTYVQQMTCVEGKNVQAKYQVQTARTVWTDCTNSLTMVTSPVYVWEIPAAQELTISDVWWAKRKNQVVT
jgi:hypothetical protein